MTAIETSEVSKKIKDRWLFDLTEEQVGVVLDYFLNVDMGLHDFLEQKQSWEIADWLIVRLQDEEIWNLVRCL